MLTNIQFFVEDGQTIVTIDPEIDSPQIEVVRRWNECAAIGLMKEAQDMVRTNNV